MRILLFISLLYRLAVTQAPPPSIPIGLVINAKCVFPGIGTINLKDTFEAGTPAAPINKRVLTVTGSLSGLCPTSSYTLSFGSSNNPGFRCQNGVLQSYNVGTVTTNDMQVTNPNIDFPKLPNFTLLPTIYTTGATPN